MAKTIRYTEPESYFPKEIRESFFKDAKTEKPKQTKSKPKPKAPEKKK